MIRKNELNSAIVERKHGKTVEKVRLGAVLLSRAEYERPIREKINRIMQILVLKSVFSKSLHG